MASQTTLCSQHERALRPSCTLLHNTGPRQNSLSSTMARRYRSKLHILQNDDLASILTPAEPCLSRKGSKGAAISHPLAPSHTPRRPDPARARTPCPSLPSYKA